MRGLSPVSSRILYVHPTEVRSGVVPSADARILCSFSISSIPRSANLALKISVLVVVSSARISSI